MKIPISVVIIAKNEEKRIKECLESVCNWAEEIIVVDDESTDKTREIVSSYTDKIFVRPMEVEGKHRNWSYGQAKCEWILSLDADERVTPQLQEEIAALLKGSISQNYFTIPRKNFIGDYWIRWGGLYPSAQVKLFRRDKLKWEEVEVHPRVIIDGECGHLNYPLLHYTYADFEDVFRKLNKQTTLEAKKWINVYKSNPFKATYKMHFIRLPWRCVDRFVRVYIVKSGWRDGFIGFMIAFFAALYIMITFAKYREMRKKL